MVPSTPGWHHRSADLSAAGAPDPAATRNWITGGSRRNTSDDPWQLPPDTHQLNIGSKSSSAPPGSRGTSGLTTRVQERVNIGRLASMHTAFLTVSPRHPPGQKSLGPPAESSGWGGSSSPSSWSFTPPRVGGLARRLGAPSDLRRAVCSGWGQGYGDARVVGDATGVTHRGVVLAVPGEQGCVAEDAGQGVLLRVRAAASWTVPTTSCQTPNAPPLNRP